MQVESQHAEHPHLDLAQLREENQQLREENQQLRFEQEKFSTMIAKLEEEVVQLRRNISSKSSTPAANPSSPAGAMVCDGDQATEVSAAPSVAGSDADVACPGAEVRGGLGRACATNQQAEGAAVGSEANDEMAQASLSCPPPILPEVDGEEVAPAAENDMEMQDWESYRDPHSERTWWWHEASKTVRFDPPS